MRLFFVTLAAFVAGGVVVAVGMRFVDWLDGRWRQLR